MVDLADKKIFLLEFFYQIYKSLLSLYILCLKVKMPIMLLYNLDLLRLYNNIRIQLRFIGQKVLEKVIMKGKYKRQKVFLPYILLQSKDNNEQLSVLFIHRQFLI